MSLIGTRTRLVTAAPLGCVRPCWCRCLRRWCVAFTEYLVRVVSPDFSGGWPNMHHWTDRAWWTVEDAARLLRVNRKTLYDAINDENFPHQRVGHYLRIPAEALGYRVRPETKTREYHVSDDVQQMELPLPAACLIPVRRFRNTREIIEPHHYERALYAQRVVTRGA